MRILMLSTNYDPVIGGAETYCRDLATGLAAGGHDVTVFTDGGASNGPSVLVEAGVTVVRDRSYLAPVAGCDVSAWERMAFGLLPAVSEAVDLTSVDVVHANSQDTAVLGALLKLQHGVPLVVTSHEVRRERGPGGAGRCRLVFGHLPVDAYIAVSGYYEQVARGFGARNVHRIDLGVDQHRFVPGDAGAARRQLGIDDGDVVLTCVARFKRRKGQLELVEAAAEMVRSVPRLRVLLVGTTSSGSAAYAERVRERITALGLGQRVTLIEGFSHERIVTVLQATDVYVQPSHVEGLGMAALEAMACGVPVVACDTDGLREIVEPGRSGLLVPVLDPRALAGGVLRLLTDRGLCERLIAGGLAQAGRRSLVSMVARTERLYRSLQAEAPAPPIVEAESTGFVLTGEGHTA